MNFTEPQLHSLIQQKPIGHSFPYNTEAEEQIEAYIQSLFERFKQSKLIQCDAEFDHYGSGYASFVEFFCYKKDGSSILNEGYIKEDDITTFQMEGISVYVSRLAPVAVLGWDEREKWIKHKGERRKESFNGFSHLSPESLEKIPSTYEKLLQEIKQTLSEAGFTLLKRAQVEKPLPFEADIPTSLTLPDFGEEYKVFDAIFYWSD